MFNKMLLAVATIVAVSFVSQASFANCGKGTTKDTVADADKACDTAKKGEICILAHKPDPACGMPGPKGDACKRDKVCASNKCDMATSKCM